MMGKKASSKGMKMASKKEFLNKEEDKGLKNKVPKKGKKPTEKGVAGKRTGF